MNKKIAFAGAQCTGKTTLMNKLNEILGLPIIPSVGREVLTKMGISVSELRNRNLEPDFQRQVSEMTAVRHGAAKSMISNRSLFDCWGYDSALNLTSIDYERLFKRYHLHYDAVLITPIEFTATPDGVRCIDESERESVQDEIIQACKRMNMPHAILRGSIKEMLEEACCVLSAGFGRMPIGNVA